MGAGSYMYDTWKTLCQIFLRFYIVNNSQIENIKTIKHIDPNSLVLCCNKGAVQVAKTSIHNVHCNQSNTMNQLEVVTDSDKF